MSISSSASSSSKPSKGWQPPALEEMQAMLPQYQFVSLLGRGGMGAVYKAVQISLDRVVAVKVLPGDLIDDTDAQFAERFKNEARTMAKMNHPAIVNLWDFGETQTGLLFIVMEFIDGTDVSKMIASQGRLPEDYALSITAHVCDALQYAHDHGVIHRDIKPANILINMEGAVKVADFGLAKQSDASLSGLTKTNMAMGTPDFVAPEALSPGTVVDGRADLYAVGVMLFQMLTGEIPRGMWTLPGTRLGTDPRFDAIINKAMQTDRELRYQSAAEIRQDLHVIAVTPRALLEQQAAQAKNATASPTSAITQGMPSQKPTGQRPQTRGPSAAQVAASSSQMPVRRKSGNGLFYGMVATVVVMLGLVVMFSGGSQKKTKSPPVATTPEVPEPPQVGDRPKDGTTASPPGPKQPVAKARPTPADNAKSVDLLALADPERDAVEGKWEMTPEGLRAEQIPNGAEVLEFQHAPPEEYDFEIEFTVKGGQMEATQILPVKGASLLWKMGLASRDPAPFGFGPVLDGLDTRDTARTEAMAMMPRLTPNERHRCVVEVRKGSLTAVLDGDVVVKWSGDLTRFSGESVFQLRDPTHLGVASWNTELVLHKAEVRAPGTPSAVAAFPSATDATWRPVFTETLKKTPGVTVMPDGWVQVKKAYLNAPAGRDMAMRARMRFTEGTYVWPIRFRDASKNGLMHYGLSITRDGKFLLHRRVMVAGEYTSDDKPLKEVQAPRPFAEGTEFDLEVAAQGDRLMVKLDGEMIIDVRDTFHQGGRTQFGGDTAVVEFKNLEWRPLSASGKAADMPSELATTSPGAPASAAGMDAAMRQKNSTAPLKPGGVDALAQLPDLPADDTFVWEKTSDGISVRFLKDPGPYKACLALPVELSPDYVAEVWFTIPEADEHVGLTIPVGDGRQTTCWIWPGDGGWAGFGKVDGKDPQVPDIEKGCSSRFQLPANELTHMRTEVRRTPGNVEIHFRLNGLLVAHYNGPTHRLSTSTAWYLQPKPELVQIGGRRATFHRVVVKSIDREAEERARIIAADPHLTKLDTGFKARYTSDAQRPFEAGLAALNQGYVEKGLARARATAEAGGRAGEVAALDAEKAVIENGQDLPAEDPAETPDSLKTLRSTYRSALEKLKAERQGKARALHEIYLKALDDYVIELTKAGRIPDAEKVQALREDLAQKSAADLAEGLQP